MYQKWKILVQPKKLAANFPRPPSQKSLKGLFFPILKISHLRAFLGGHRNWPPIVFGWTNIFHYLDMPMGSPKSLFWFFPQNGFFLWHVCVKFRSYRTYRIQIISQYVSRSPMYAHFGSGSHIQHVCVKFRSYRTYRIQIMSQYVSRTIFFYWKSVYQLLDPVYSRLAFLPPCGINIWVDHISSAIFFFENRHISL